MGRKRRHEAHTANIRANTKKAVNSQNKSYFNSSIRTQKQKEFAEKNFRKAISDMAKNL